MLPGWRGARVAAQRLTRRGSAEFRGRIAHGELGFLAPLAGFAAAQTFVFAILLAPVQLARLLKRAASHARPSAAAAAAATDSPARSRSRSPARSRSPTRTLVKRRVD